MQYLKCNTRLSRNGKQSTATQAGDERVAADMQRVGRYGEGEAPRSAQALAGRLLATVYMGTANSSGATRARASALASQVGLCAARLGQARVRCCYCGKILIAWLAALWLHSSQQHMLRACKVAGNPCIRRRF